MLILENAYNVINYTWTPKYIFMLTSQPTSVAIKGQIGPFCCWFITAANKCANKNIDYCYDPSRITI